MHPKGTSWPQSVPVGRQIGHMVASCVAPGPPKRLNDDGPDHFIHLAAPVWPKALQRVSDNAHGLPSWVAPGPPKQSNPFVISSIWRPQRSPKHPKAQGYPMTPRVCQLAPKVRQLAPKGLLSGVDFPCGGFLLMTGPFPPVANGKLSVLAALGFVFVQNQLKELVLSRRLAVGPWILLETIINSRANSHRLSDSFLLLCIFGCRICKNNLEHYVVYDPVWGLATSACGLLSSFLSLPPLKRLSLLSKFPYGLWSWGPQGGIRRVPRCEVRLLGSCSLEHCLR